MKLLETLSQLPILSEVDKIKKELDALRPLSQEVEGRVMQKLKLEWNFHSNAIEGNKLTYGETYTFLMYGLTAKGKPFKDHLDIKGHDEAIKFLISLAKDNVDLREVDIRDLHKVILVEPYESPAITQDGQKTHKIILVGEYKKMPNHVKTPTGETHYYATPEDVPILMGELVAFFNEAKNNPKIHPSVLAAFLHHRFVAIHPFDDGNGRLGRILMNLVLMQFGFPPAIVKLKERTDYYAALNQADKNEYEPIIEFVAEALLDSMKLYIKAANGGNIEESEDLDKEIALFKASLEKKREMKSDKLIEQILLNVFKPLVENLYSSTKIDSFFHNKDTEIFYVRKNHDMVFENPQIKKAKFSFSRIKDFISDTDKHEFLKFTSKWSKPTHGFINSFEASIDIYFDKEEKYQIYYFEKNLEKNIKIELFNDNYDISIDGEKINKIVESWNRNAFENLKKQIESKK